jgi:putative phage-type endonuclease
MAIAQDFLCAGVTPRQLHHWTVKGWIRPEPREKEASGSPRVWPKAELEIALRMLELVAAGVKPDVAHTAARDNGGVIAKAAATQIGTFEQGTEEWHAARAEGLGGSEIAAVLGLSPFQSRFSLWHRKAGLLDAEPDNAAMSWGRRLEDPIAEKFAEDHPEFKTLRTGTWRNTDRPWQIANPDRMLAGKAGGKPSILEVKTAHAFNADAWGPSGTDQVPVYYRCQAMWYLDVFQYAACHMAVLIGGSDYREYVIVYDQAEVDIMRDAAEKFLVSVAAGERPDIDESDSTYQTIRGLRPDIDDNEKEISNDLAGEYLLSCADFNVARKAKQRVTSAVLDALGSARYATYKGDRIAMRAIIGGNPPHLRSMPWKPKKEVAPSDDEREANV